MGIEARVVLSYFQKSTQAHRKVTTGRENWPPSREEILEWLQQYIADPQAEVALVTIGEQYCQFTKGDALTVLDISNSLLSTSRGLMNAGVIAALAILEGVRAVSCHMGTDVKGFLRDYNSGRAFELTPRRIAILKEAMERKGLSAYQVVQKAGLSQTYTFGLFHEGRLISTQNLNKILGVLDITIEHLW